MNHRRCHSAFTLVEMSIVLVIIGLLVGGIMISVQVVRSSELRTTIAEFQQYQTALGSFKDKYSALPGDMPNAVRFWGAATGGTGDGLNAGCDYTYTTPATTAATCNGDGSGTIGQTIGLVNTKHEIYRLWQQLANAGMIEGQYSGVFGSPYITQMGVNVPKGKAPDAGWVIIWAGSQIGNANVFDGDYGNAIEYGASYGYDLANPVMKAEEAYMVDMKLDDGKPQSGVIRPFKNPINPNCVPASNDKYSVENTNRGCALQMISGF